MNHILNRKVHPGYTRFKADFRLTEFRWFHCTSVLYSSPLLNSAYPSKLHPLLYGSLVLRNKNVFYLGLTAVTLRFAGSNKKTIEKAVHAIANDVKPMPSMTTHVPNDSKKGVSSIQKKEQSTNNIKKTSSFDTKPTTISGNIKSVKDQVPSHIPPGSKWFLGFNTNTSLPDQKADDKLKNRMVNQGLLKEEKKIKEPIAIQLENGTLKILGDSKPSYKLSPLGNAYREQTVLPEKPLEEVFVAVDIKINQFQIMVPNKSTEKTFIETAKNKHLVVLYNPKDGEYYVVGYLTSKKTAVYLCSNQFQTYQTERQTGITAADKDKSPQHIVFFDSPQRINKTNVCLAKWGKDYFTTMPEKSQDTLVERVIDAAKKGIMHLYNSDGITRDDCSKMCDAYDETIEKK